MNGNGWHLLLCGLLAAPMFGAASPPAIGTVMGRGEVRIDGISVPSGAVLYNGDRIDTSPSNSVSVYMPKNDELAFGPLTSGRVAKTGDGFTVDLDSGKIVAVGAASAPIIVNARGLRIESSQANGSYEVMESGETVEVLSLSGETLVRGANRTVSVPARMAMRSKVDPGKTLGKHSKILLVTLIAAAAAGAGIGFAVTVPGATCVSASQLNCP